MSEELLKQLKETEEALVLVSELHDEEKLRANKLQRVIDQFWGAVRSNRYVPESFKALMRNLMKEAGL